MSSSLVPISMPMGHAIGRCRNGVHDRYLIEGIVPITYLCTPWFPLHIFVLLDWISPAILHFCQLDHLYLFLLQQLLLVSMMLLIFMLSFYLLQFASMPPWFAFHVHVEILGFYFNCLNWCSWLLAWPYASHSSLYFLALFLPLPFGFYPQSLRLMVKFYRHYYLFSSKLIMFLTNFWIMWKRKFP